jgi:hypothetical protein
VVFLIAAELVDVAGLRRIPGRALEAFNAPQ